MGDQVSLTKLLVRLEPEFRAQVARDIPSWAQARVDAEDIISEAWTSIWQSIETFKQQGPGSFHGWVSKIVKSKLVSCLRHERQGIRDSLRERSPESLLDYFYGSGTTPSRYASRREAAEALERAIDQLPFKQREIVRRRWIDGQTFRQIRESMGLTHGGTYRLHNEALEALRKALGPGASPSSWR